MQAHCTEIKKRFPNAKTVFIGPCVAKKDEAARYDGIVDAVLTFEELTEWLKAENTELEKDDAPLEESRARLFPTSGGILKTMAQREPDYTYMVVDGTENCIAALKDIEEGKIHKTFIEMSSCRGSCIGGPVMEKYHRSPVHDFISVSSKAGKKDFAVDQLESYSIRKYFSVIDKKKQFPTEAEISSILRQMGKVKRSDELNCGSCGYNTCSEKEVAFYQGKAENSMCLACLKDKEESFSDNIVNNTPNGIIVLNEQLEVQQINRAACRIMNLSSPNDILGDQVVRIMDPMPFVDVCQSENGIHNKRTYLAEYKKYVELTVTFDKEYHILIAILRDVTDEEDERRKKENINRNTVEIADKVVDKQMRIVQEIASLLGETAAETKIALTKLKELIDDE